MTEANLIVEAAAGTGKTESLIYKILDLVYGERQLKLSRILALTFTEKAANEMRKRLSDTLAELVRGNARAVSLLGDRLGRSISMTEAQDRAREALVEIESAQITTIHSFCAYMLRLYPIEAEVAPDFEVDEGDKFEALFDRRWKEWLDEQLAEDGPAREDWETLLSGTTLARLRELAGQMCRKYSIALPIESSPPSRSDVEKMLARGRQLLERLGSDKNDAVRSVWLSCELMQAYLDVRLRGSDVGRAKWIDAKAPTQKKYEPVKADIEEVARYGKHLPGMIVASKAARLLSPFAKEFREELVRKGFLTFEALLAFARRLLHKRAFVRYQLKTLFSVILVDEFQDTDPIQYDIIMFLSERPKSFGSEVRQIELEPNKLYIVGDPKQSIYAFRGADIEAYEVIKQVVIRNGGRQRRLDVNYRSRAEILEVVNTIFSKLMIENRGLQPGYIAFKPYRVPDAPHPEAVEIVRMIGEKLKSDEARDAEARYIAEWIEGNAAVGERGRIAILLRSLNDVQTYLDMLRRKGIPYVIEGEKFFYQAQEIIDFTNLLEAVVNPHNEIAVVGFLRSFAAGLGDPDVFALRGKFNYLVHEPDDAFARKIYARLRELHEFSTKRRVDELVDRALEIFPFLMTASATYYGPQAVSNLLKIRMRAAEAARTGRVSAASFVDQARRSVEGSKEEGESPIADERIDAVKVLTIHRSKGLEFDTVFLPDMHRKLEGDVNDTVLSDWSLGKAGISLGGHVVDEAGLELRKKIEDRLQEETRRVLYVAMTRAKSKLILTGRFDPRQNSFARLLCEALPALPECTPGLLPAGGGHIQVRDYVYQGPWKFRRKAKRAKLQVDARALGRTWEERKKLFERVNATPLFVSPSSLAERLAKKITTLEEPDDLVVREKSVWVGIVCHDALARLDFDRPRWRVSVTGAPLEHQEAVEAEAKRILEKFAATDVFRRLQEGKRVGREVPFVMAQGDQCVSGRIDLLLEEKDVLWVLDYKTGGTEDFRPQLEVYRQALQKAVGAKPVKTAVIHLPTGRWIEP